MSTTTKIVHFTVQGEFLTDFARQQWVEDTPKKAVETLKVSLVGIKEDMAIEICTGKRKICGDTGVDDSLWVEDDKEKKCCGISLDPKYMLSRLRKKYENTYREIKQIEDILESPAPYYEEGVKAALEWVLGDAEYPPMEE